MFPLQRPFQQPLTPKDKGHEKLSNVSIRQVSSRVVYRNPWMTVREDQVERDGQPGIYGVVEKHDSAVILPIDGDHIYLVEQFRYPIGRRSLELPQGSLEVAGLKPEAIARGTAAGDGYRRSAFRDAWRV